MTPSDSLPRSLSSRGLSSLIEAARAHDGSPPFSDGSLFDFAQGKRELIWQTDAAAALFCPGLAELVVAPQSRRQGLGSQLVTQLLERSAGPLLVWAHGDLPGARALAARFGFEPVRTLLRLKGTLSTVSDAVSTSAFTAQDTEEWLALNARAFAHHPEQAEHTKDDLRVMQEQPWYSDDNFLLLRDANGQLIAYCWLKVENGAGEIYVVGVEPARQGEGWGRAAMEVGLARLRELGIHEAHLYVEGSNVAALRLYHSLGFTETAVDVQYRLTRP